jgi:ketosteroid isomerase-like protein
VTASSPRAELGEALRAFDETFRRGDLEELARLFAPDIELLVHQQEAIVGKDSAGRAFGRVLEMFDTSDYAPRYDVIEVHGDRAYVLGPFEETLSSRSGEPGIRVHGRVVLFWRRDEEGWRITRLLTGRSAPDEPIVASPEA